MMIDCGFHFSLRILVQEDKISISLSSDIDLNGSPRQKDKNLSLIYYMGALAIIINIDAALSAPVMPHPARPFLHTLGRRQIVRIGSGRNEKCLFRFARSLISSVEFPVWCFRQLFAKPLKLRL
jgi:hypothetical protein